MVKRQLLLLSSSRVHGYGGFLEYASNDICNILTDNNVSTVLFIPYAKRNHEEYLRLAEKPFKKWGFHIASIHTQDPQKAIQEAEAIFIGGGNTFRLLKTLYELDLVKAINKRVLEEGVPYIGSSAGSNVATRSIHTTNDMPIVWPPSLSALNLVPFCINPHFQDNPENSTHMGETREDRILDYQEEPDSSTVLGLREGATLYVKDNQAVIKGIHGGRLYIRGAEPKEIKVGSDISYLLQ
ncbi:unnamed protein product [Acanthoscelides obtectus]|uniref:dipeptidase E n=1 Tax=Acanthoscelides obtectus TaxID=200917 RepID=A0A9P0KVM5_ACAOB|nr:unnamed protein product [Acanthoscelides obtectus]CAK1681846.1 Alpha-aspartyl dipeptidase [Acanthoscelides obtectus]